MTTKHDHQAPWRAEFTKPPVAGSAGRSVGASPGALASESASESAAEISERWRAEAAAVKPYIDPGVGVPESDQWLDKPGIALLQAMLGGLAPPAPMALALDYQLLHVQPGRAIFQGRPSARFNNPMGSVHGGWFATLLDSALGCAVHTALPAGQGYTTLELKLNLIRALSEKVGLVRAEGRLVHLGGQTATAEARLVGPDGKLYAHGSTTCLVFPYRKAG